MKQRVCGIIIIVVSGAPPGLELDVGEPTGLRAKASWGTIVRIRATSLSKIELRSPGSVRIPAVSGAGTRGRGWVDRRGGCIQHTASRGRPGGHPRCLVCRSLLSVGRLCHDLLSLKSVGFQRGKLEQGAVRPGSASVYGMTQFGPYPCSFRVFAALTLAEAGWLEGKEREVNRELLGGVTPTCARQSWVNQGRSADRSIQTIMSRC